MRAVCGIGRGLLGDREAESCADELSGGDHEESPGEGVSELASIGALPAERIFIQRLDPRVPLVSPVLPKTAFAAP